MFNIYSLHYSLVENLFEYNILYIVFKNKNNNKKMAHAFFGILFW